MALGRLGGGLVAVRAAGCEIEVLRQCVVPGTYAYRRLTRKNDQVLITSVDDLYAQMPIGAVRLESKLARSGKLDVRMSLVGMLEAPVGGIKADELSGDCAGATHVIVGAQLGAFQFFAGGSGEMGAGLAVGAAGLGGRSEASRELLSADGDPERCDGSIPADARPPEGCGAVIRIELARLMSAAPLVREASWSSRSMSPSAASAAAACASSRSSTTLTTSPASSMVPELHRGLILPPKSCCSSDDRAPLPPAARPADTLVGALDGPGRVGLAAARDGVGRLNQEPAKLRRALLRDAPEHVGVRALPHARHESDVCSEGLRVGKTGDIAYAGVERGGHGQAGTRRDDDQRQTRGHRDFTPLPSETILAGGSSPRLTHCRSVWRSTLVMATISSVEAKGGAGFFGERRGTEARTL